VYENGDRKKPVDWFIGSWSSFSESDFIRLILITQIRNKLLGINDDETFVESFILRTEYRYMGYQFLDELRINSENIRDWKYESTIGKSCSDNILTHVDSDGNNLYTGMYPLAAAIADGKPSPCIIIFYKGWEDSLS